MPVLFAITLFVSASLLFMVQPMVGKLVLPLLGGSPAVWNACMVFFQALLLLGYLYADRLTRLPNTRHQWIIHIGVMSLPIGVFLMAIAFSSRHLPIAVVESLAPTEGSSAIVSVLAILLIAIGIPFFVVSTSATLLQKWFTYTGHPSARDPYFLYAASNFGSLISLLGYPIFIEPNMTQGAQTWFWAAGFVALFGLITVCGYLAANPLGVPPGAVLATAGASAAPKSARSGHSPGSESGGKPKTPTSKEVTPPNNSASTPEEPPPTWLRRAKWTLLAFVPSSLMLGVTFHMTTDIASVPLLWVGPLALYLITFIIAFGRVPDWFRLVIGNLAPVMILLLVFVLISDVPISTGPRLLLHLLTFFAAALMCHYELARDRPPPKYLTTYFLIMSFGGVLGGIFNSLIAPVIFVQDYEYKLVMVIACFMVPGLSSTASGDGRTPNTPPHDEPSAHRRYLPGVLDVAVPVLMGIAFWQLLKFSEQQWYLKLVTNLAETLSVGVKMVHNIIVYAVPVMACFFFVDRPIRFGLCVAAILGLKTFREEVYDDSVDVVYTERSFFGILKVEQRGHYTRLVHGTTLHGTQINEKFVPHWADELQRLTAANPLENILVLSTQALFRPREEPLTYYHRTGPVGAAFTQMRLRKGGADANADFAMVGLGTGSVSCYANKGQRLTYYEIDPAVIRIVETPWLVMNPKDVKEGQAPKLGPFTYVQDARDRGAIIDFRVGDARLKLKEDVDRKYTMLLVDAFSSDSIPVHLLTNEAVGLYLERLTDDGILALHISNKFVHLEPVVAAIAEHHNLVARVWNDGDGLYGWSADRSLPGKTASSWVLLARTREALGDRICSRIGDLVGDFGEDTPLIDLVKHLYPELKAQLDKVDSNKSQEAIVNYLEGRTNDPNAQAFATWMRKYRSEFVSLGEILHKETGYGFRPVRKLRGVEAWTDDYADVMRVMMIRELQAIRKFFGLPTPVER